MADAVKLDSTTKPAHKSKKIHVTGSVIMAALGTATMAFNMEEYDLVGTCIWVSGFVAVGYAFAQGMVEVASALRKAAPLA